MVYMVILLVWLGSAGATSVGPFSSMEECHKAGKQAEKGSGTIIYRCINTEARNDTP